MNKLEAIKELKKHDHCFITPLGVKKFTEPFGFQGSTYLATDNRSEFKGLDLGSDRKEGDKARGQEAHIVAQQIADKLGVEYRQMLGIGSALRECCSAIEEHLTKT